MKRQLFNLAAAVSLVLCTATAVLWVRSQRRFDTIYKAATPTTWSVVSSCGAVTVGKRRIDGVTFEEHRWRHLTGTSLTRARFGISNWSFLGFASSSLDGASSGLDLWTGQPLPFTFRDAYFTVPYWFLIAVAATLPLRWLMKSVRHEREKRLGSCRRCPTCGYDLRATPQRCPECGTKTTLCR